MQNEGRLSFANESPARDMTAAGRKRDNGTGHCSYNGNNRLSMGGDVTVNIFLFQLNDNSVATGTGLLTLRGNQTLTGTYGAPVSIDNGATWGSAAPCSPTW